MAIFEKPIARKVLLDDTEQLTCVIENWRNVNGHTEFVIRVQRGPSSDNTWKVQRRYNEFHKLHSHLQTSGVPLAFPPKKLIGNMEPDFIKERLRGLQKYLDTIMLNPILCSSVQYRSFIDPAHYCQPFGELSLQHVSLALRNEASWEVVGPLAEIGWRLRKHYYQLRCKTMPDKDLLGSWTDYGPDKYLEDKDMHAIFKSISQMQHPFLYPAELCLCTDIGGLVVRAGSKDGSLRDLLYNSKPKQSFMKKYGNPAGHKPLEVSQIALYGRQILEALKFLHDKGLPYGHLHTGNVVIENERAKLLDIENGVLGVPSFYRPYFMQHRKINTLEAIDVYCFGHTLYEMTFGSPLHESLADTFPDCSSDLKSILESILSVEACKAGLPTIESLLGDRFFGRVILSVQPGEKAHLKIPNSTKERLKTVWSQMEQRLRDEQKMVRNQKRLVKVQEMMSSEEEKKKQRHKLRQEQKAKEKEKQKQDKDDGLGLSKVNGNVNDKSESANSSASASIGTATPPSLKGSSTVPSPPPPPPSLVNAPPPPPPPALNGSAAASSDRDRSALLGAICNFDKSKLKPRSTKTKPK